MKDHTMRCAFLFLVGMLVGCVTAPALPAASPPAVTYGHVEAAAGLADKTVALVVTKRDGKVHAYCSGTWVSKRTILTAVHCMMGIYQVGDTLEYVVQADLYALEVITTHLGIVLAVDDAHDLALVRAVSAPPHEVATLSPEVLEPGMFVQTMGMPLGLWYSYSSGEVSAVRMSAPAQGGPDILFVQTTAAISPGNSGGALFDRYGAICGVAHATMHAGQNLNFFVHRMYVDALLDAARKAGAL